MWLIDTSTLQLHYFHSLDDVVEGYAILSHTWDAQEQTFQDLQNIHTRCAASGADPRSLVSPKITGCCNLAKRYGYAWAWIDTCCIDKSSSAELSEAINSMYGYYARAMVCYAYLVDVPSSSPLRYAPFSRSRWHTRGWTLQELIAPQTLYFLSSSWEFLGSRYERADLLQAITGIPAQVLRDPDMLQTQSVAQRMSWAARRRTTRVEDEAYCLLGIFDINMPTLYGEGRKAFLRLQEEIMTHNIDTTLFAWGCRRPLTEIRSLREHSNGNLIATAPSDFRECANVTFSRKQKRKSERRVSGSDDMSFSITPHGILARIPIVALDHRDGRGRQLVCADLGWQKRRKRGADQSLFLLLSEVTTPNYTTLPQYNIGREFWQDDRSNIIRIVAIPRSCIGSPVWSDVYFTYDFETPLHHNKKPPIYLPINHSIRTPVRIPEHLIAAAKVHLGASEMRVVNAQLLDFVEGVPLKVIISGFRRWSDLEIQLRVGMCLRPRDDPCAQRGSIYANVGAAYRYNQDHYRSDVYSDHLCAADHVLNWSGLERRFEMPWSQLVQRKRVSGVVKPFRRVFFFRLILFHSLYMFN